MRRASAAWLLLYAVAGAGVVVGCGWMGTEHSVRFHSWRTERDFGRLPPLPFKARAGRPQRSGDAEEETALITQEDADAAWKTADEKTAGGDLAAARKLLLDFLANSESCRESCQSRRNSAADLLDAMSALDSGTSDAVVRSYVDARRAYDSWLAGQSTVEPVRAALELIPRDKNLDDNALYLRAAILYRENRKEESAQAFGELIARHPRSEKREAALLMSGMATMKGSASFGGEYATATDACPECRDEGWQAARASFLRLLKEYPRGRYRADARGWLAYLSARVGDTAEALVEYYRLLGDASEAVRVEARTSLTLIRGEADDDDMKRVESMLAAEPETALTYAYHNIYNYQPRSSMDAEASSESNPFEEYSNENYRWQAEQEEKARATLSRKELARVAAFATRLMRRHPRGGAGGGFALRVAQADLELGDARGALELARRALGEGVRDNERAAALWVKAVAEHRLREFDDARRTLSVLLAEYPQGDLTEGARRLLAMAAEDAGDIDAALEQYLALDYSDDMAYFVDVLMTPEQLASFVETHAEAKQHNELLYALGVRYLRAGRWNDARQTLARVVTTRGRKYDSPNWFGDSWSESGEKKKEEDPKYRFLYEYADEEGSTRDGGVLAQWVLRDVKTANDLERLEREAAQAAGDEARAEALYQFASYMYEGSNLLFYNPSAWAGRREQIFANYEESRYRAPAEGVRIWRYMQEHEAAAHALSVYLDVARRYPETRAARDALYTAAVCHERLSNFSSYWRYVYGMGLHAGDSVVTYHDVKRVYPNYRLPVGTNGWEPSTRTVSGQAAWPAAPKPEQLTRSARVRRKLKRAEAFAVRGWQLFGEVAGGRVRRWSLALLSLSCFLLVFRATRTQRATLFEILARFARREPRTPEVMPRPSSSFAAQEPYAPWARAFSGGRGVWQTLRRTLLDERGRAALAINFLTHGLLTALLWALTWALRSG
jgi:TolA-binding protein